MAQRKSIYRMSVSDWAAVFAAHLIASQRDGLTSGLPQCDPDGLNVLGVRMNPITAFYVKGVQDWNDFLVLVEAHENRVTVLRATTDPAVVRENPKGIAHLAEGCWDAYVRGIHKAPWRKALVQRAGPVKVIRTDAKGRETCREVGYFGINVHNAMGLFRPSAGCTVIKPAKMGMRDANYLVFRDILKAAPDRPSRTYSLMNAGQLEAYGYPIAETLA